MSKPNPFDDFSQAEKEDLVSLYREIEADVLARAVTVVAAMEKAERRLSRQAGLSFVEKRRYIERADALVGAIRALPGAAFTPKA